jgi:hypothetical protein
MKMTIVAAGAALAIYAGASQAETVPERLIGDLQADFDLKDFQAAGIVGALSTETGNFRYMQELNPIVRGSRGGIGYAQWTGPRRVAFEEWAGPESDLTAYEVNYGYLSEELKGEYAYVVDRIRETETVRQATNVFMRQFLRPHPNHRALSTRVAYAEAYLAGDFTGAGCQSTHEVSVEGRMMLVAMCDVADGIDGDETLTVQAFHPDPFDHVPSAPLSFGSGIEALDASLIGDVRLAWSEPDDDAPGSAPLAGGPG